MAARTRFALVFWMAVAVEVAIPTIKPWASAPECQSKSAEPIAEWEIIYRPQHWSEASVAIRTMNAGGRMCLALSLEGLLTEVFKTGLDVRRLLRPFP